MFVGWIIVVMALGIAITLSVPSKLKWSVTLIVIIGNTILSSIPAVLALTKGVQLGGFELPHLLGKVVVKVDGLSAWFILIINFTTINGLIYGLGYLKSYSHLKTNLQIHWIFYILLHTSLLLVTMFDSGIAFLFVWEMMSLATLMLLLFDYQHKETLRAGLNFLVQMHICVVFLIIGFIMLYVITGSCSFSALSLLTKSTPSLWIFALLFVGFAIKAGFIPFHTWLPVAHPAAPSHVSGVMSGVIVKMGIYGIFRVVTNLNFDQMMVGEAILGLSVLTAIYGISNAAVTNDFKRMLAFCTIENIGIIGIGIGLGLIGLGINNTTLTVLGFGGALLHTLNHSLFKSLLFFGAGSVFQQTHTRDMDKLGGLVKKMPATALFFLIGAMAIGGLPPFNGFVSEFMIYFGLFNGLSTVSSTFQVVVLLLTIMGLALVGGLSLLTFTKTFGVIFLGKSRKKLHIEPVETTFVMHLPQYFIVIAMISVAIFPQFYFHYASQIVTSFMSMEAPNALQTIPVFNNIAVIGRVALFFIGLIAFLFGVRWLIVRKRESVEQETWGCAYIAPIEKAQYTGSSFAHSFSELFNFFVKEHKKYHKLEKSSLYPTKHTFSTLYFDILDEYIIAPITRRVMFLLNYFKFIQNGLIQFYLIYGIFFVLLIFVLTALSLIE